MVQMETRLSTGLPGLDRMLKGLMPGDNIVWQVDSIQDYIPFVRPYCETAMARGKKVTYFRFAKHEPLVPEDMGVEICTLEPEKGFETFIDEIHRTIELAGRGAFYVFDCLSDLAVDWYSDRMVGNFFMLTCPYLYDLETITYFALLRDYHSIHAIEPISETTQLLLDAYRYKGKLYVHPLKVQHRYSPTMHMLHVWEGDAFVPVSESYTIAEVLTSAPRAPLDSASSRLGVWDRTFLHAEEVFENIRLGVGDPEKGRDLFQHLLRMVVSRDDRVLALVERYFGFSDLIDIGKRMIGTGLIGGKSVGMLLARAILKRTDDAYWATLLEIHDSFYIGSDVFYTFLVRNRCWSVRRKQRDPRTFLEGAETARQGILTGTFPPYIQRQFEDMLEYFGQSPIIVRSSSLLEDNFGNAFAGKYDSVFCANQGSREKRLADFVSAVRTIYASTMSERALSYRARRGILDRDEQMALLVQRVSGSVHGSYFYPQIAGVGFSFNPYVWSEYIDPEAGMLRLVFGLGTRAVDRSDDDYTRVVALNAPERRPESDLDKVRQHAQRSVDVIDLEGNQVISADFATVAKHSPALPLRLFASRDLEAMRAARDRGVRDPFVWFLTFDELLTKTPFIRDMREMLRTLHEAYEHPVDVEFTANFLRDEEYRINVVQCRPFQVKGNVPVLDPPAEIPREDLVLRTHGPVIGQSRIEAVDRIIYVVPSVYGHMPIKERYSVARVIGQVVHHDGPRRPQTTLLLGPGRWGTTTPSLGVPVSFAEINIVTTLCEIVAMTEDIIPDVSLGTHFFSDLVEFDILYMALFPEKEDNFLNGLFFDRIPNKLAELVPRASGYTDVIKVVDTADLGDGSVVMLNASTLRQRVVCYVQRGQISGQ
jgi:hypothetical protein